MRNIQTILADLSYWQKEVDWQKQSLVTVTDSNLMNEIISKGTPARLKVEQLKNELAAAQRNL